MSPIEKSIFGVSVEPIASLANENQQTSLPPMGGKTILTSTVPILNPSHCETPAHQPANPFSCPVNGSSPSSASKPQLFVSEHDLEAGASSPYILTANTSRCSLAADDLSKEDAMWPTQQTLKEKAKTRRRAQGCSPMKNLSRKQRLLVKLLIALVVVSLAVGLGVGISRAVGGGVWKSEDSPNVAIPHGGNGR